MAITNPRGGAKNSPEDLELMREIGARIRQIRIAAGFPTPLSFARHLGYDENGSWNSNLGAIENGRHYPRIPLLLTIAEGLGVTVSEIVGDADRRSRSADDQAYAAGYRACLADMQDHVVQLRRRGVTTHDGDD